MLSTLLRLVGTAKQGTRRRGRKNGAGQVTIDQLEQRLMLTVDLTKFATFLPQAVSGIQQHGVNEEFYNADLPFIATALSAMNSNANIANNPTRFLDPIAANLQTALTAFNNPSNANKTETNFLNLIANEIDGTAKNVAGNVGANNVEYELTVTRPFTATKISLASNLGFAGLGISLNGNVEATLEGNFTFKTRVGVDVDANNNHSFYINTDVQDEVVADFNVELKGAIAGRVGLLQFSANATEQNVLTFNLKADLQDPNKELRLSELNSAGVNFVFGSNGATVAANLNLGLMAEFGNTKVNPKVNADLKIGPWIFSGDPEATGANSLTKKASAPSVAFNNVRINVKSGLLDGFISPLLRNVREITAPLEPIVEAFNVSPLKKLGPAFDMTLLKILQTTLGISKQEFRFFEVVSQIVTVAREAQGLALNPSLDLMLGSFGLGDIRSPGSQLNANASPNVLQQLKTAAPAFASAVEKLNGGSLSVAPNAEGFSIQFLSSPIEMFKLFVGGSSAETAELFRFNSPVMNIGVAKSEPVFEAPIPPFGPLTTINVDVEGSIGVKAQFSMGYDAKGLVEFRDNPSDVSKLASGFYIDTRSPLIQIAGYDPSTGQVDPSKPILGLVGSLKVGAKQLLDEWISKSGFSMPDWIGDVVSGSIDFNAEFGVKVGLLGDLRVGLSGEHGEIPPNDRLRLNSLGTKCLFTTAGGVSLGGNVFADVSLKAQIPGVQEIFNVLGFLTGTKPIKIQKSYDWKKTLYSFPNQSLFTFNGGCPGQGLDGDVPPEVRNPQLGKLLNDGKGTLRLNVGDFVGGLPKDGKRQIQPKEENEEFRVEHVSGSADAAGGETVRVYAFGVSEEFSGVKRITADCGEGNDEIIISSTVTSEVVLLGGSDNDTLVSGAGAAYLDGGSGFDKLIGSPKNDTIRTGSGGAEVDAGAGDDLIFLGSGNDTVFGGDDRDTVRDTGNNNWTLRAQSLSGRGSDTLNGVENVELTGGGSANNFVVAEWPGDVKLSGLGANDSYSINITGSSSSQYSIFDSSGIDSLTIVGTESSDEFVMRSGTVEEQNERVTYSGIDSLLVSGKEGQDQFNVRQTASATPVQIRGDADSDIVRVSSNAGINDNGNTASILGSLQFDAGGGGANRLVVSNYGGAAIGQVLVDRDSAGFEILQNIAPVTIRYRGNLSQSSGFLPISGPGFAGYDQTQGVIVRGSNSQGDAFLVRRTADYASVKLEGNGGTDVFQVGSTATANNGNLDFINGPLTIISGLADDRVFVSDRGKQGRVNYKVNPTSLVDLPASEVKDTADKTAPRSSFAGIFFDSTLESLRLDGTDAANIFDVSPSLNTEFFLDGNLPVTLADCAAKGDFLRLNTTGTNGRHLVITQPGAGFWTFTSPHKYVRFESIERFNHVDIVAIPEPAGKGSKPRVRVFDAETMEFKFEFLAYEASYEGGMSVAVGDVNEDGLPDVVTAPGRLRAPEVRVFNGSPQSGVTGGKIAGLTIPASKTYGNSYAWGVNVAVGDVNGDGCNDIVTAPRRYIDNIKVFQNAVPKAGLVPFKQVREFDAFADLPSFIGGANIAVADLDGKADGNARGDIIVGSGSGIAGQVRVFDVTTNKAKYTPIRTLKDSDTKSLFGVYVAAGDTDGDGDKEILTSGLSRGSSIVKLYHGKVGTPINALWSHQAFTDLSLTAPAWVAMRDFDDDGNTEFYVHQMEDGRNAADIRIVETTNRSRVGTIRTLVTSVPTAALQLDRDLGLQFTGNYLVTKDGVNAKWMKGADANWYFITPDGKLNQSLDGSAANSRVIAELPKCYHEVPQLLDRAFETYSAANADFNTQLPKSTAARLDSRLNLTKAASDSFNLSGQSERWLNGLGGTFYITPLGDMYKASKTNALNRQWVGRIDARFQQNVGALATASVASALDSSLKLTKTTAKQNIAGVNEKWLLGTDNQNYFITSTGKFYRWGGGTNLKSSTLLEQLDADYYKAVDLLAEASLL